MSKVQISLDKEILLHNNSSSTWTMDYPSLLLSLPVNPLIYTMIIAFALIKHTPHLHVLRGV